MSSAASYTGNRIPAPSPGAEGPERTVARLRGHARRLFWSALVLIAIAGATGWFLGQLPEPFEDWMLMAAASAAVLLLVLLPWCVWLSRRYVITTKRVIEQRGLIIRHTRELHHTRGYDIRVRRGPLQRIWRTGTLTLSNGVDAPMRLANIPDVTLVHETLVDQVEVGQILAHRAAQTAANPILAQQDGRSG